MAGWVTHEGQAFGLPLENVDTDQLIPARFMSTPRSAGYAGYLLHDMRRRADGTLDPDFGLNSLPDASVMIAQRNFGSGSSREAAVYALVDAGFRVVLAPSFGHIFASNAVGNGLLPACISPDAAENLLARTPLHLKVDLDQQRVVFDGGAIPFEIDPVWRLKLMNGWDDIDLTRAHLGDISAHAAAWQGRMPWSVPPSL